MHRSPDQKRRLDPFKKIRLLMPHSSIEFQIGTTAICLRGQSKSIEPLRPFLKGFPHQSSTPIIQLALEEFPDLRQTPPRGKIPRVSLLKNRWTLEQQDVYILEINRSPQTGTLRYIHNNSGCPASPPKGAWLALKALFSLDALMHQGLMIHASAIRLGTTGPSSLASAARENQPFRDFSTGFTILMKERF